MMPWFVNRDFEAMGLIPEVMLELDDLVLVSNRDELIKIFQAIVPDYFPNISTEEFSKELDNGMLASWSWYCLKRAENPWAYINCSGKYAHIFGRQILN